VPSFQKRRLDDGSLSVVALVRIKGFKPVSKAFRDEKEAKVWATSTEAELKRLRDRGSGRNDTTRMTIRTLCESYLNDPKTLALKVARAAGLAQGSALVVDTRFVTMLDRQQVSTAVSAEDRDNFIKNLITMLAEMRGGLAVYNTDAVQLVDLAST
jgi:hypothetical protein